MALFPLINGNYFSHPDIEVTVLTPTPFVVAGVKSINYKDNLSKQFVYGTASQPIGVTKGKYEATGDIEFWLPQANLITSSMGPGWKQIPVTITISYVSSGPLGLPAPGLPQPVITDTIPGAFLMAVDQSSSEGDAPLSRKFTLKIAGQILWNGVPSLIEPLLAIAIA